MNTTYRIHQELGAKKADTSENLHYLCYEADVENRLCKFYVAEVSWTFCHVA